MNHPTACLFLATLALSAAGEITTVSLVREMTDLSRLAEWPSPPYQTLQASSHDRASKAPGQAGWFANADWSHFIREENHNGRSEHVMMEDTGPGAIVRIWNTWFGPMDGKLNHSTDGVLRIYLDGNETPAIEGSQSELFVRMEQIKPPFAETVPPAAPEDNRAHSIHLPIPYAKSCKITYESKGTLSSKWNQGEAFYYQINYRRYPADTPVKSFRKEDLAALPDSLDFKQPAPSATTTLQAALQPGETRRQPFNGPAAIHQLKFHFAGHAGADELATALRSTELQIEFDGEPCAKLPVADFFATGTRISPFHTATLSADANGMLQADWFMPFAQSATLTFANTANKPVSFSAEIRTTPHAWTERSMHFHATHSPSFGIRVEANERGARDINFATLSGQGRLVGDTLFITNQPDRKNGVNWWGEGDEKIHVDGESFPSHFGTGTEDYYGYAHCRPEPFSTPFHAQPYGDGNLTPGNTAASRSSVNTRIRLLDDIPFHKSLRFDMELWHWKNAVMDFVPTTFHYQKPEIRKTPATGKDNQNACLFSYFTGNGEDGLHLATSRDGRNWKALRGGASFLKPVVGGKLMRDPCVFQGPDGMYHLVFTTGWEDKGFGVAHSRDLVHWSEQSFVPVMEGNPGAKNCWAPEIIYDPETSQYLIHWSTTIDGAFNETAKPDGDKFKDGTPCNHRIYFTCTRDFKTYSKAALLYDPGFNCIDATILPHPDGGWIMWIKDETKTPKPQKNIRIATAKHLTGTWSTAGPPISPQWVEGPSAMKLGESWFLYFDAYTKGHYQALSSTDLKNWSPAAGGTTFPKGIRHGTAFTVPENLAESLEIRESGAGSINSNN